MSLSSNNLRVRTLADPAEPLHSLDVVLAEVACLLLRWVLARIL